MTKHSLTVCINGKCYTIPAGTPVNEHGIITNTSFIGWQHEAEYYNIKISKQFLK